MNATISYMTIGVLEVYAAVFMGTLLAGSLIGRQYRERRDRLLLSLMLVNILMMLCDAWLWTLRDAPSPQNILLLKQRPAGRAVPRVLLHRPALLRRDLPAGKDNLLERLAAHIALLHAFFPSPHAVCRPFSRSRRAIFSLARDSLDLTVPCDTPSARAVWLTM